MNTNSYINCNMKKIDSNLNNFIALGESDCVLNAIVYYTNKQKAQQFFYENNIPILNEVNFINAFVVCLSTSAIIKTASQNCIYYISSVAEVNSLVCTSKKILGTEKCFENGNGVTIAFIDTGISNHLDFKLGKNKLLKFVDFVGGKQKNYDDNGHGTFVSSVACGLGSQSGLKFSGVASGSNIVSLKALDKSGEANAVLILKAMQWIFDNYKKYNIKVVCMSFGSEPLGVNDPILVGAEKLWDEGIVVVCAGGNSGPLRASIKSPGISKKIITVGGLNDNRNENFQYDLKNFKVADFSSRGPANGRIKPDVIAPSVNIVGCSYLGGYKKMNGTSVATPMVAGLVAIMLQKYPYAEPKEIKNFLIKTAKSLGVNKFDEGYGVANIEKLT